MIQATLHRAAQLIAALSLVCIGVVHAADVVHYQLDIPPQPLTSALQLLAKQTGLELVYFPEIADGHDTRGIRGEYTRDEALKALLRDTGLTYRAVNDRTIELRPQEPPKTSNTSATFITQGDPVRQVVAAETAGTTTPQGLEEILVTAQRREQSAKDVPITITTFSGVELQRLGVSNARDLAAITPGVVLNEGFATGVPVYSIRGVGFDDFSITSNSTVGLYADDVALPYPVMTTGQTFDVQRVEVLKGPQGDLYGRNSTAGAINVISNRPSREFSAGTSLEYGRFEVGRLDGFVTGSVSDAVQARFAFTTTQAGEGWQRSAARPTDTTGKPNVYSLRLLVAAQPSESLDLLFNLHFNRDRSAPPVAKYLAYSPSIPGTPVPIAVYPGGQSFPGPTHDPTVVDWTPGVPSKLNNKLIGGSVTANWALGGTKMTSITAYDQFKRNDAFDADGTYLRSSDGLFSSDIKTVSEELRLASADQGPVSYLSWDRIDEDYLQVSVESSGDYVPGIVPGVDFFYAGHARAKQKTTSESLFGHAEWEFIDRWRLILGTRLTHERRDYAGCTYDGDPTGILLGLFSLLGNGQPLSPGACLTLPAVGQAPAVFHDAISTTRVMGRLGLDYRPDDDWLYYITLATASNRVVFP